MRKICFTTVSRIFLVWLVLVAFTNAVSAQLFYVSKQGSDANNGLSWNTAFASIQKALTVANYGSKILVGRGTYFPDEGFGATNDLRTASFVLKQGVSLYGGFDPAQGIDDLGDTRLHRSTLSGDLMQNDISGPGTDNAYSVVTAAALGNETLLDGFTIRDGNGTGGPFGGAGMYNNGASPTINNCAFVFNTAPSGAGMYNLNASPIVTNSSFLNNTATDGGGIVNNASSPRFTNCSFAGNTASRGGAICNLNASSLNITNCSFGGNAATTYGGGVYNEYSNATLINCVFSDNTAGTYGGAINNWQSSTIDLMNCTLAANTAGSGGAIYEYGPGSLTNCIIWGNTATTANGSKNIEYTGNANIMYSLVQDHSGGTGNLDGTDAANDPLFVNLATGDLALQAASPAINMGNNDAYEAADGNNVNNSLATDKDLSGNARLVLLNIDMGAYEYNGTVYTYYFDNDQDGYGGPTAIQSFSATPPDGYVADNSDCNDADASMHPGADEICGEDNNCDGITGTCVECIGEDVYYDADGDGYGGSNGPYNTCQVGIGPEYVTNNADCNDGDNTIYPGAPEIANDDKDNNCNGQTDENNGISRLYVNKAASGANNGTSWTNAYNYLQDALAHAKADAAVTEIWVAKGTYYPDEGGGTTNNDRAASFIMQNNLGIYGGFNGYETQLNQRNWNTNETILSGDIDQNDGPDLSNINNNSYHLVLNNENGLNNTAIIDGFTIKSGLANLNDGTSTSGAGILNRNASPLINNCKFINNSSSFGAAIANANASSVLITNCIFETNYAVRGGAIFNALSEVMIKGCSFINNFSEGIPQSFVGGGAIDNQSSHTNILNCRFTGNKALVGGAVMNSGSATSIITNSIFIENFAQGYGGAIFNYTTSRSKIVNSSFYKNTAVQSGKSISNAGNSSSNAVNSIFWGDIGQISNEAGSADTTTYSIVEMGAGPIYPGTGNSLSDPFFVDAINGDLHLQNCSPARNKGNDDDNNELTDLDGNPRKVETIDMGAYEGSIPTTSIIYVNKNATGLNDGSSWQNAYNTLQDALAQCLAYAQVWVAKGTYYPDEGGGKTDNDKTAYFMMKNNVAIYGGFAGNETSLDQRNWKTNKTILSGDIDQNDNPSISLLELETDASRANNSINVIKNLFTDNNRLTPSARIDGFTITGGQSGSGAGISNTYASPTIVNCVFTYNFGFSGGALHNLYYSSPQVINCLFNFNLCGNSGGAILSAWDCTPSFINSTIVNNSNKWPSGHSITNQNNAISTLTNCIIWENPSGSSSAGFSWYDVNQNIITYSLVYGGFTGEGNISANPLFVDEANGDYRLQLTSPAVNTGSNAANDETSDLDANPRKESRIDMGAYEAEGTPPAFINCPTETITADATTGSCSAKIALRLSASGLPTPSIVYSVGGNTIDIAEYEFPVGTTAVSATASNGFGDDAVCFFSVTVTDEQAPVLTQPGTGCSSLDEPGIDACLSAAEDYDGTSLEAGVAALYTDNCGNVTATYTGVTPGANNSDCGWSFTYHFTISDGHDNSLTCSVTRSGGDQSAPTGTLEPAISYLWPPNHKMRTIPLNQIGFSDNCDASVRYTITSVSSNEPVSNGDGDIGPDWIVSTDKQSLQLRAERSGTGTGRVYTIHYELSDDCGNITPGSSYVFVNHDIKKPVIGASYKVGSTIALSGEFGDKAGNRHTAKWIIDGMGIKATVTSEPAAGKPGVVTGSWKPTAAGVYAVQLNITDQNGNTSYVNTNGDMQAVIVVYDPNGGYTYGQGMFKAAAGSVPSNPLAAPLVTYGFQSNYFKKATNPKGETQLDFDAGDFRFNALNFDYLAVNGKNAQFKGTGKISNADGETIQSGVYFVLTVADNGENTSTGMDKIRMKIYNKNTGQVYFDNQPGAGDAVPAEQAVIKGSTIAIVSGNMTAGSTNTRSQTIIAGDIAMEEDELRVYPNPATDQFTVRMKLPGTGDGKAIIQVLDITGKLVMSQGANTMNGSLQAQVIVPSSLRDGMYIVKVVAGNKQYHRKLLLVK